MFQWRNEWMWSSMFYNFLLIRWILQDQISPRVELKSLSIYFFSFNFITYGVWNISFLRLIFWLLGTSSLIFVRGSNKMFTSYPLPGKSDTCPKCILLLLPITKSKMLVHCMICVSLNKMHNFPPKGNCFLDLCVCACSLHAVNISPMNT